MSIYEKIEKNTVEKEQDTNKLILNEWVYVTNVGFGQMFAATTDKDGDDHIVEVGKGGQTADKYQWKIYKNDGYYFIQNKSQGFMFSATGKKYGDDHVVECRPSLVTLESAIKNNQTNNKWSWKIKQQGNDLLIVNNRQGQLFAAHKDLKGEDHVVETQPGSEFNTDSKFIWTLVRA
ncbi:hypothetical protein [uncultured Shewanella sp.]|uniref:hypothetical protein n=1 Tax=uncultured Shewanella sp. TaxID=173975 RepID=UPI00260DC81F|nr:hypothetical protein [uncultured Shewanella sp.]